jgi:hypothetical protein
MAGAEIKKEQNTVSRKSASFFIEILLIEPIEPGGSIVKNGTDCSESNLSKNIRREPN